jgi:hypothetical protein
MLRATKAPLIGPCSLAAPLLRFLRCSMPAHRTRAMFHSSSRTVPADQSSVARIDGVIRNGARTRLASSSSGGSSGRRFPDGPQRSAPSSMRIRIASALALRRVACQYSSTLPGSPGAGAARSRDLTVSALRRPRPSLVLCRPGLAIPIPIHGNRSRTRT